MAAQNSSFNLPQGFSVYQPVLGAQLQFFPNVGTPELDDLINSFIPGPVSMPEKRATIALDFFEYVQLTGENFKFYPVFSVTPMDSPATASPLRDSSCGSFNASPVMSNWDWSQVTAAASKTSNASRQRRSSPKTSSVSRHQPTDFSHLPGMKIMTKDGLDVTNSASRGSKTKEQRDHAHLMRIIKACDSCKKKKVRCDPSHKKRGAAQAQPQSAAKTAKKMRAVAQEAKAVAKPIIVEDQVTAAMASFVTNPSFAATSLESLDPTVTFTESWEEFVHYPTEPIPEDYDFFNDPEGHLSPRSFSSLSASSSLPSSWSLPGVPNAPRASLSPITNTDQSSDLSQDRSPGQTTELSIDRASNHAPDCAPYRDPGLDRVEDTFLDLCYYSALDTSRDSSLDVEEARIDYSEYVGINHNSHDHVDHTDRTDRRDLVNVDGKEYAQIEYRVCANVQTLNGAASIGGNGSSVSEVIGQASPVATNGNYSRGSPTIAQVEHAGGNHTGLADVDAFQLTEGSYNASSLDARLTRTGDGVKSLQRTTTSTSSTTSTTRTSTGVLSPTSQILKTVIILAIISAAKSAAAWLVASLLLVLVLVAFQSCLRVLSESQDQRLMCKPQGFTKQLSPQTHVLSSTSGPLGALRRRFSSVSKSAGRVMMSQARFSVFA